MRHRVLHAVDEFGRRSETFVYTFVTHQQAFDASLLCHTHANIAEFPFDQVYVEPKPRSRRSVAWWIAASIERAGGRSPWRRAVEAVIERARPDVIHAHFGPVGCELAPIAADLHIPLITSLYGVDAAVLPYLPRWRDAYRRLFRTGRLFLAEGPEMRRKLVAAGARPERTALQPIAIDLARYPVWAPDEQPTVLFVGRFVEKKGLLDAIAAFARARTSVNGLRLIVIGGGPDDDSARSATRQLGVESSVEFVGMKPHAEAIDCLRRTRVLLHPSATAADGDSEGGAPTILLEAQAVGTPIVSTRHADIPNVVPEGPGVFLCAEHDIDALARGVVRAVFEPHAVSRAHVAAQHATQPAIARLERHYLNVLAAGERALAV